jgi:hypothetical protein
LAPDLLNQVRTPPPRTPVMLAIAFRFLDVAIVTLIFSAFT